MPLYERSSLSEADFISNLAASFAQAAHHKVQSKKLYLWGF
ncbi:hypothetical protein CEV31_4120 [Brucella thiophenivorans]|uniref:Uncharacterized protein n=1 Tax=Brucella thiophenivorans TaxID=571255 RepID=A0A256EYL4_9HYPH|nr:hypothetical protein CEV31_4120 [Brucella thiophenivorans]